MGSNWQTETPDSRATRRRAEARGGDDARARGGDDARERTATSSGVVEDEAPEAPRVFPDPARTAPASRCGRFGGPR
jgi:hypothetical protein